MNKYGLNFEGTIGEFVKVIRKSRKINSKQLSLDIGRSDSYISHLENNRYKNIDYDVMYKILKKLGIEEKKIDDYLFHFGIYSPERIAADEAYMMAKAEPPTDEEIERLAEESEEFDKKQKIELEEYLSKQSETSGESLLEDMISDYIRNINTVLHNLTEHDFSNGYEITKGISDSLTEMATNITLYKFNKRMYSEKLSLLDEEGSIKVLNTLYEELNRIDSEKTAFGKPRQRKLIEKL